MSLGKGGVQAFLDNDKPGFVRPRVHLSNNET